MSDSSPTFSVVVPTWNDAAHLDRSLRSVLLQSFQDFELIVVDDGSTDSTRSCVEALSDPKIRYIYQDRSGVSKARNRGLQLSRGAFLAFLDSDDQADVDWLKTFAEELRDNDVGVVCCGIRIHNTDGEVRTELPKRNNTLFADQEVLFLAGTFAVRRSLLLELTGYRPDFFFSENTELGIRLVHACKHHGHEIRTLRRPLLDYYPRRLEDVNLRRERQQHRLAAIENLLAIHSERFCQDSTLREIHLTLAGTTAVRAGQPKRSHHFFWEALCLRPRSWKHYARWLISFLPGLRSIIWKP